MTDDLSSNITVDLGLRGVWLVHRYTAEGSCGKGAGSRWWEQGLEGKEQGP